MKSLVNKIFSSDKIVTLRNSFKVKPIQMNRYSSPNTSISDAFLFRTDQDYSTYFRFSDILNIFYNIKNSKVELIFYDNHNNFIKILRDISCSLNNVFIEYNIVKNLSGIRKKIPNNVSVRARMNRFCKGPCFNPCFQFRQ